MGWGGGGCVCKGEGGTCSGVWGFLLSEKLVRIGELGESEVLPTHSGTDFKLLDPKLLIKIDQASSLYAINAQFESDHLLSTWGIMFTSFNMKCLVLVFGLP